VKLSQEQIALIPLIESLEHDVGYSFEQLASQAKSPPPVFITIMPCTPAPAFVINKGLLGYCKTENCGKFVLMSIAKPTLGMYGLLLSILLSEQENKKHKTKTGKKFFITIKCISLTNLN
jgi:hypothetical protein